ncbi:uncharacterized protein LAJ45_02556 [Morchella importuna]|uniref:uncharacterized protein n=1 Tax=Morchella importuna TaxID=1174673 RepID=UPI001E8E20A7|nr:uncharacterized protein LAJ45_02556 [Morchella importuna]KAH8153743.1 hypothetical protein LAJ45_02556 [Morchella importuna]
MGGCHKNTKKQKLLIPNPPIPLHSHENFLLYSVLAIPGRSPSQPAPTAPERSRISLADPSLVPFYPADSRSANPIRPTTSSCVVA